jgi:hypothetical protein
MASCEKYGRYFWQVETNTTKTGFTALYADEMSVEGDALVFYQRFKGDVKLDRDQVLFILPGGSWTRAWAASMIDGQPVCVDHF